MSLSLGLNIGLPGGSSAKPWSPGDLPNITGIIDPAMSFTDLAASVPAGDGGLVQSLRNPVTGNQLPCVQTNPSARPTLTVSGGQCWLNFDGVDDGLFGAFPIAAPAAFTFATAVRVLPDDPAVFAQRAIGNFGGGNSWALFGHFFNNGRPSMGDSSSALTLPPPQIMNTDVVLIGSALPDGAGRKRRIWGDLGGGVEANDTNGGPVGDRSRLDIGGTAPGAQHCKMRLYAGVLVAGEVSMPDQAKLVAWLRTKIPQ
jgi:hypothetical protein